MKNINDKFRIISDDEVYSQIKYTPLEKYERKKYRIKMWVRVMLGLLLIAFFLFRKFNVMYYLSTDIPSFFTTLIFSLVFLVIILYVYQFLEFKKLIMGRESYLQGQEEVEKKYFTKYRKNLHSMKERIENFCAASIGVGSEIYKKSYHQKYSKIKRISFLEKKYQ